MTEPLHLADFLQGGWRRYEFEYFREGVEICRLVRGEPELALLRYAPGASVPKHLHMGLETILVLEGSQSDEFGHYGPGALVTNPQGHRAFGVVTRRLRRAHPVDEACENPLKSGMAAIAEHAFYP